jgi:hypothetical protein
VASKGSPVYLRARLATPLRMDSGLGLGREYGPMKCALCEDCGWICERHADKPWEGMHACPVRRSWCSMPGLQRDRQRPCTADAGRLQNRGR